MYKLHVALVSNFVGGFQLHTIVLCQSLTEDVMQQFFDTCAYPSWQFLFFYIAWIYSHRKSSTGTHSDHRPHKICGFSEHQKYFDLKHYYFQTPVSSSDGVANTSYSFNKRCVQNNHVSFYVMILVSRTSSHAITRRQNVTSTYRYGTSPTSPFSRLINTVFSSLCLWCLHYIDRL